MRGAGGLIEDFDDGVARRYVESVFHVTDAEKDGEEESECEKTIKEDCKDHYTRDSEGGVRYFFAWSSGSEAVSGRGEQMYRIT